MVREVCWRRVLATRRGCFGRWSGGTLVDSQPCPVWYAFGRTGIVFIACCVPHCRKQAISPATFPIWLILPSCPRMPSMFCWSELPGMTRAERFGETSARGADQVLAGYCAYLPAKPDAARLADLGDAPCPVFYLYTMSYVGRRTLCSLRRKNKSDDADADEVCDADGTRACGRAGPACAASCGLGRSRDVAGRAAEMR